MSCTFAHAIKYRYNENNNRWFRSVPRLQLLGRWNGDNQTVNVEVEDDIADTLLTMLENAEPDEDGDIYISDEELWDAVQNGHPELEPLHDELADRCHMMEVLFWCNEAYDCIDESLKPYFYKDVEDGLYEPQTDEDYNPEDGYAPDSFYACRDNYLDWVNSHRDDHFFVAERVGVDIAACSEDDPYYVIKGIK